MDALILRSIEVGTDLARRSDAPLRAGAEIAELTGAALHVVHAFDLHALPPELARRLATFPERVAEAEQALTDQIERVVPRSVRIASRKVEVYLPAKAILERAREVAADVIMLGRRREPAVADRVFGSTADQVVREAAVPCLVVPGDLRLPFRSVVAAIDPVEPAAAVAEQALAWASWPGTIEAQPPEASLHLVAVIPDSPTAVPEVAGATLAELAAGLREVARRARRSANVVILCAVERNDSPARGIRLYAERVGADLLVLGTRAPGPIRRALLGSVASAVAREASEPVLLVPPAVWRGEPTSWATPRRRDASLD